MCERVADCCARFAKCSKYKCWWSSDPLSDGYEVVVSSARAVCSLSTSLRYCDTIAGPQRSFVTPRPGEIPAWATQPADGLPIDERPLADPAALVPGSPVAVPFKNRAHGERFYLGRVVKPANTPRTPTTALVRFDEVEGPPSKYLVDHDRLFIPDFPLA